MNGLELTASITAVGNMLACRLSDEELALASAVFMQLGDTLSTIAAVRGLCDKGSETTKK